MAEEDKLQEMLRDALLNNTYDHSSTHKTLNNAWENSFSYLYNLQIDKIKYDEYHYYSNDEEGKDPVQIGHFYLDGYIRACFDIDKDIIHVSERAEFRSSKYYHNYFTFQDMVSHPTIFLWIPIVIIDDHLVWDWEIQVISKDAIQFRMPKPFKRQWVLKNERDPVTDEIIYVDHTIQVMVVENIYFERLYLNRLQLFGNGPEPTIKIPKVYLNKKDLPRDTQEGIYFVSIAFPKSGLQGQYLGSMIVDCYEDDDYLTASMNPDVMEKIQSTGTDMEVNLIFINQLHRHTWYTGLDTTSIQDYDGNIMVLNRDGDFTPYAMPIPTENFVIFHKRALDDRAIYHLEPNTQSVKLYYPNIYRLVDPNMKDGDTYKVFYFYHYSTYLKYTCLYEFWYRYLVMHFNDTLGHHYTIEEIFDRIWKGTMDYGSWNAELQQDFFHTFLDVMHYQYTHYTYAETDYIHNWLALPNSTDMVYNKGEVFEYKEGKLKDWIKDDPWLLRDYVVEQKKVGTIYHLFTNTLDLSERYRTDTSLELDYTYEFNEPMYVFAVRNEREYPVMLDIRFFVDGIFVEDLYQDRRLFMDYLFVPARMVTQDSYLEMEVFPSYDFKFPMRFHNLEDTMEVSLPDATEPNITPTYADAYLMQRSGQDDEHTHLYENSLADFVQLSSKYPEDTWDIETHDSMKPVRFTRLKDLVIRPTNKDILDKDVDLWITKHPIGLYYQIDDGCYPYLKFVGAEKKFAYNREYIRVYRNGRLLPDVKWLFYSSFECPRIQLLEWFDRGDTIYFDITPFRYKMIYYQEKLEPKQLLVDLSDIINKPFSWKYYDVYMNGRRLSMNNLFSILPWKITMVNLKSIHNLAIYEKDRDWEYYGLDYKEHHYFFTPDDLFKKPWVTEAERNQLIKDMIDAEKDDRLNIYPNTDDEPIQNWDDLRQYVLIMAFYYNELIPKTFVNPSVLQFNKRILSEEYPIVYDTYVHKAVESARNDYEKDVLADAPDVVFLDPNTIVEGENSEGLTYVYMVGHPDDVDDEYLAQTVVIENNKYSVGGEI